MAGRRRWAAACRHFVLVLCLVACIVRISIAEPAKVYDIDLAAQSVADALTGLSEQTGVPVVFSYDLVKGRTTHPVVGHHTLLEALDELLKNTGLSGGLSEKGVLTVWLAERPNQGGETIVTQDSIQTKTDQEKAGRRRGIAAFFASLAAAFSASAAADDVPDTDGGEQKTMASIIVTAQKREEREVDVPIAMTVLKPDDLTQNGQSRLVDYFSSVPGLNLSNNSLFGGTQYVTIRGLSTKANSNSTVATVVDDVPLGSSQSIAFGSFISPDLDPSDLARVEVLKGPQGTLYGADSLGGLIKYVTADPSTGKLSGRAEVTGIDIPQGGAGYAVRGAANIPVSDTLAVRISGFSRRDPGYVDYLTTGEKNFNSADVYGGRLSVLYAPSENFSAKLSALLQNTNGDGGGGVNSDKRTNIPSGRLGYTSLPGTTPWYTRWQLYTATLKGKVAGLDITSVTGYNRNTLVNWEDVSGYAADGAIANKIVPGSFGFPQKNHFFTEKFSQEIRLSSTSQWLDWLVGGFYTHESSPGTVQQAYAANINTGALTGLIETLQYYPLTLSERAVFADLTFHVTDRFDVQIGGRQSWNGIHYESVFYGPAVPLLIPGQTSPDVQPIGHATGNPFTYLVTPKFAISPDLQVYGRVATGYRIGGPNFITTGIIGQIPQDYKPDRTTNFELGVKGDVLAHLVDFDLAYYYIKWKDLQINEGFGYTSFTTNAGGAKSEGVELQVDVHPWQGFTLALQGSYDDAELTQDMPPAAVLVGTVGVKGDRLPFSTRASGGFTVNQEVHLTGDWVGFAGGGLSYIGPRPFNFNASAAKRVWMPGYTQLNLHTGVQDGQWLANLYLNNVTDRRGVVGFNNWPFNLGNAGAVTSVTQPRTIGLNLSRSF